MIEVNYEVYRFKQWRKSKYIKKIFNNKEEFDNYLITNNFAVMLEKSMKIKNQGKIRNLTYKYIG